MQSCVVYIFQKRRNSDLVLTVMVSAISAVVVYSPKINVVRMERGMDGIKQETIEVVVKVVCGGLFVRPSKGWTPR